MQWALRLRIAVDQVKRRAEERAGWLHRTRADFASRYREVCDACAQLPETDEIPLAAAYMREVLRRETGEEWWRTNREYLTEPWFIWEYGCRCGLVKRRPGLHEKKEMYIVRPQEIKNPGAPVLQVSRRPELPEEGEVRAFYAYRSPGFAALMDQMRFYWSEEHERFVKRVGEVNGPVVERAVEAAVTLLENGYSVCVEESALRTRILEGSFLPKHRRWIAVDPQHADRLRLYYPKDPTLHGYLLRIGAQWTGRYMEIPVSADARLEDIVNLYDFRLTREAKARMEIWHEAVDSSRLYNPRRRKETAPPVKRPEDRFKAMLQRTVHVIDDLRDRS